MESSSFGRAWGGCSGWSNVKSSSVSKSKSGDAVIGWMLEAVLMSRVGVAADCVECLAKESKKPTIARGDKQLTRKIVGAVVPTKQTHHMSAPCSAIMSWKDAGPINVSCIPRKLSPSGSLAKPLGWVSHSRHACRTVGHFTGINFSTGDCPQRLIPGWGKVLVGLTHPSTTTPMWTHAISRVLSKHSSRCQWRHSHNFQFIALQTPWTVCLARTQEKKVSHWVLFCFQQQCNCMQGVRLKQ